jgi:DNA-binding SARP family transcriptional activator
VLERQRLHPREVLAGLFWSEYDSVHARGCLNTALWRLRRVLEPDGILNGTYLLTNHQGDVGFNRQSQHWLDVEVFEEKIQQVLNLPGQEVGERQVADMESALALYTGDLLEGLYEDWALRAREYLRRLYLNGLAYLMHYYRRQRCYEKSLAHGQRILDKDPLREEIHREMMRLYAESGQRPLGLRQYEICRAALDEELGIQAMEETQMLYEQLLSDLPTTMQSSTPDLLLEILPALRLCHQAAQTLAAAQSELQQALQRIEALINRRS